MSPRDTALSKPINSAPPAVPMPSFPALRHTPSALLGSPRMFRRSIAVIGAGASGLVASRELRREGHDVVVFERGCTVGGTWVYTPAVESDLLGLDPNRKVVHSSLYNSLRTNLPRECMGFFDYPFVPVDEITDHDPRRFPGHREVLRYLESFSRDNDLYSLIRFGTEVVSVEMEDGGWTVRSLKIGAGRDREEIEVYDGVVVCSGHFTEPRVADIPGIEMWPGKQMHSHNYRIPQPFLGQVIVVIGSSASAADISREIAGFAREVHGASRSSCLGTPMKLPGYDNLWLHSMIERTLSDGTVVFQDGSSALADVILHCTGYKYYFPFLKTDGIINVDDNRVAPLYKHVFPPLVAPYLSFIGLPWKVVPFPLCELQSKWVAGVLSGRIALPTPEKMMEDIDALYLEMEQTRWPVRYTHNIGDYQALGNRSVQKSKGKKKEHSPQDAAMTIQRTFRDYMSRHSRTVHCLRDLAVAKSKLKEIRILISRFSYRHRLAKDAEERQRFSEKIIILLLTVDSIEAPDYLARSAKRSMTRELEEILEAVDPQLMGQRKFHLPSSFSSMAMASSVADVVRMLDQEDANGSSILPAF